LWIFLSNYWLSNSESLKAAAMALNSAEDDREPVALVLPLDRDTLAWLMAVSGGCDRRAAEIIAESMREIALDDEAAHSTKH
jgi:hypothetical protein